MTKQIRISDTAYELAKKAAKRERNSMTDFVSMAIECYANSDRKLKRIAKHISILRGLLFGKSDSEPKAPKQKEEPAPKAEALAPEEEKFAEQKAALMQLMKQLAVAHKAGDVEAERRIVEEGKRIRATMVG